MHTHLLLFAAMILLSPAPALAQTASPSQPVVSVTARAIRPDGARGASAGGTDPLVIGRSVTHYLHAGRIGQDGLCTTGSSDGTIKGLDDLLKVATHVWKVTATGVSAEQGRQTFDLEWSRYDNGHPTPATSRKQRLTLAERQPLTLDMLHDTSNTCSTASIVIEIEAWVREDPALADTMLKYDLWLVRTGASGKKETKHFVMTGKQGTAVPFAFAPLQSAVPTLQANQYDFEVRTNVSGELRGRARQDGRLSVEVTTSRRDVLHHPGQAAKNTDGLGEGRKVIDANWGESVEIRLPSWRGSTASYASEADAVAGKDTTARVGARAAVPGSPRLPVEIRNGYLVVDYDAFFANETVALILRITKAESTAESASPSMGAGGLDSSR